MDELVKILAPKLRRLTIPVNYGSLTDYLEITDCMSAADLLEAQSEHIAELEAKVALYEAALKYIASNKDDWHLSDVAIDALGYDPEEGKE